MPNHQWRFKKTKYSARKKLILANDNLFRQIIRIRDKVCQKTGKATNLQVAHFWRRNILRTRWDMDNACLLQGGIHLYWAHSHFQDFTAFWKMRLGEKRYNALELRARYIFPVKEFDLQMINLELKELLNTLTQKIGSVDKNQRRGR